MEAIETRLFNLLAPSYRKYKERTGFGTQHTVPISECDKLLTLRGAVEEDEDDEYEDEEGDEFSSFGFYPWLDQKQVCVIVDDYADCDFSGFPLEFQEEVLRYFESLPEIKWDGERDNSGLLEALKNM